MTHTGNDRRRRRRRRSDVQAFPAWKRIALVVAGALGWMLAESLFG